MNAFNTLITRQHRSQPEVCLSVQVEQCNIQECPCKCKPSVTIKTELFSLLCSGFTSVHDICYSFCVGLFVLFVCSGVSLDFCPHFRLFSKNNLRSGSRIVTVVHRKTQENRKTRMPKQLLTVQTFLKLSERKHPFKFRKSNMKKLGYKVS